MSATDLQKKAKQLAEERAQGRKDLLFLANEICGYHFIPEVHGELFDQFLKADPSKPFFQWDAVKDLLVLWPRGHYKTTALTVLVLYLIINNPDIQICIMRSTLKQSQKWLKEIAEHFTGERPGSRFREVYPEFCGDRKAIRLTANKFETCAPRNIAGREPTVYVASFTSDTTGDHYDIGFFDDLVTKENYKNPALLQKVIDGFWAITPQVNAGGYRICSGTRYAHGDLYDDIMRKNTGNWRVSVKDCWKDGNPELGPLFPEQMVTLRNGAEKQIGFTTELLLQYMAADPAMFASQYLNRPAIEGITIFSESQFSAAKVDPESIEAALSLPVLFVDIAASTAVKADDSVILCGKHDGRGTVYLVDGIGHRWEPENLALNVIAMTVKHRPAKVMLEGSGHAKLLVPIIKMLAEQKGVHVPIDFIKVDTQADAKTIRVKGVATYLTRGRLKIFNTLPCYEKMVKQFLNFSGERNRHDDYPDTVALMMNFFANVTGGLPQPPQSTQNNLLTLILRREREAQLMAEQQPEVDEYAYNSMGDDFAF